MKKRFNEHRKVSPDFIASLTEAYRASGLGLAEFARQRGVSPGRLHYWVYQKGRTPSSSAASGATGRHPTAPTFQEVEVGTLFPEISPWAAEVGLPRGLVVRFRAGATVDWIGAVIHALERPC